MINTLPDLTELITCRHLLDDELISELLNASDGNTDRRPLLISKFITAAERLGLSGNLLGRYILYRLIETNHIVSATLETACNKIGSSLYRALLDDLAIIRPWLTVSSGALLQTDLFDNYQPTNPRGNAAFNELYAAMTATDDPHTLADKLLEYYNQYGCGIIADFPAFRWDSAAGLVGIKHFENTTLTDIIGYDKQKNLLVHNTAAFIEGKPAHNTLLTGARGTGKSTSVKALANEFFSAGLRLVQLTKQQLLELPPLMEELRSYSSKKFIIFIDDLSFEDFESEYKYLKSAIEGGVEGKPDNVLIYATSNRRHLIKDNSDEQTGHNDIHRIDNVNERMSLADRFGLVIQYYPPTQDEYLTIIGELLKKNGRDLSGEDLRIAALRWEITHSGRSGRIAKQFVTDFLGRS